MGLLTLTVSAVFLYMVRPFGNDPALSAIFLIVATAAVTGLVDVFGQQVHLRASTGLNFQTDDPSWRRSFTKFAGLLGSLGLVALLYWLFPAYHGPYFRAYYATMLLVVFPGCLLFALPYIHFVDRHMSDPFDGYWHMGKLLTLERDTVDRVLLGQHILGWLIKGFFLPLMFTQLCEDFARLFAATGPWREFLGGWYDCAWLGLRSIDVAIASGGYLVSLRLTDTHLRSADSTMLGWFAALICYEPFSAFLGQQFFDYGPGDTWKIWAADNSVLYGIWGASILVLVAVYVCTIVCFGGRFSNLTHRGIITSGPYRWTKHPGYIAKNISFWLISMPFLVHSAGSEALRHCLLLLCVNGVYLLRARTEERHLWRDPQYVRYAQWIDRHGIFRWLRHVGLGALGPRHFGDGAARGSLLQIESAHKSTSLIAICGPGNRNGS
jgi:protein-S-isoprenylcysteine O-methyltransferase Ste14